MLLFTEGNFYYCMLSERTVYLKKILDKQGLLATVVAYNFTTGEYEEFDTVTDILKHPDGFEKRLFN